MVMWDGNGLNWICNGKSDRLISQLKQVMCIKNFFCNCRYAVFHMIFKSKESGISALVEVSKIG